MIKLNIFEGPMVTSTVARFPRLQKNSRWLGAVLCCGSLFGASYATEASESDLWTLHNAQCPDQIYQLIVLQGVVYAVGACTLVGWTPMF